MNTNLHQASHQWASRPADQRFSTLAELKQSVLNRRNISYEGILSLSNLIALPGEDNSLSLNYDGIPLNMTNWSFNQLSNLAGAPATYLKQLPAELVAKNLNYGLQNRTTPLKALVAANGGAELRALTSEQYGRIWDIDIVNHVERVVAGNSSWHNPPARESQGSTNSGLYASDRDVFIFMVDEDHKIADGDDWLSRGFFMWNSEVGKSVFGLMTFLYRYICGNHIVWGAKIYDNIRIKHTSRAPERAFTEAIPMIRQYMESSSRPEEEAIKKAKALQPAKDQAGMIDWLLLKGFRKSEAEDAYGYAVNEEGDGTSLWNIVQGLTAMARDKQHIDARFDLEQRAGKLLEVVS